METQILLGLPVHAEAGGPIDFEHMEWETNALSGLYLQYAYLLAKKEPVVALEFAAGLFPCSLRIGKIEALQKYDPTVPNNEMKELVLQEFGKSIFLPKPTRRKLTQIGEACDDQADEENE